MMSFRFRWIGLLAALWMSWGHGDAFAQKLYWTDVLNHKIQRADVDCLRGLDPNACIETVLDTLSVVPPTTGHPGAKSPNSVVVDSTEGWIYWSEFWTGVHRTTVDGQTTQTIVPTPRKPIHESWLPPVHLPGLNEDTSELLRADIQGIAIDPVNKLLYFGPDHPFESPLGSKYLYPNTAPPVAGARIWRSNLDGSSRVTLLSNAVDGFPGALGLDLTGQKMYWGSPATTGYAVNNRLMRADLDGKNMESFLSWSPFTVCDPHDAAVDAEQVYFTCASGHGIWRVGVNGSGLQQLLWNLDTPEDIVVAGDKMYFAEVWRNAAEGGRVSRANLDGSGYEPLVTQSSFLNETFPDFPFAPNGIYLDTASAPANLPPVAIAKATDPTSGYAPLTVNFSGADSYARGSDGSIQSYRWDFGDGTTSDPTASGDTASHRYERSGSYDAVLTVTDDKGAEGTCLVTITVTNASPTAGATADPTSGYAPLTVSFNGSGSDSDGDIESYSWDFGDGSDPTPSASASHIYQRSGNYHAVLTLTDNLGAKGTAFVDITVTNRPPTATATASPMSGPAPLTVSFTGAGSDSDGTIKSYSWDFGDGSDPTPSPSASHIYQRSGNYHAVLTVTDNSGDTGTASVNISVANRLPVASATANPTSGPASLTVSFTGAGSDLDGSIKSYSWAFGDGGTSSSISLSHTYDAPGNYTAVLTVTDDEGGTGTSSVTIIVQHPSQPDLIVSNVSASPSPANPGDSITVTDTTNNPGAAQAAPSMTLIYFSLNTTLDAGDTLIGSRSAGVLSAGSSSTGSTPVTIPASTPAGTYYVIVMADGLQGVGESSEANNTAGSAAISVLDPNSRPDLIVSTLNTSVSSTDTGVQVKVTDTTKNRGAGKAAASQTHIYLSSDATLHPGDPLLGSRPVVALNAGTNSSVTTYVPIPDGTLPGTYFVIVMADGPQALGELNETNNTRSKSILVPGPDLVVLQLSAPTRVIAGTPFTVKDTTKNQGTKPTVVTSRTNYYLSTTNSYAGRVNDTPIAYREVGPLAAGASSTTPSSVSNNVTIPSKGTWYIVAVADGDKGVPETDENDNDKALKITVQ